MEEKTDITTITVEPEDAGKRLDAFLASRITAFSRSRLQKAVSEGEVLVNEKAAKPSYKLRAGDAIDVEIEDVAGDDFAPEDIPLDIIFEDEHLAVVNKPAGMVVHPGAGVSGGTLANAISFHFGRSIADFGMRNADSRPDIESLKSEPLNSDAGNPQSAIRNPQSNRVGIVHRLDKDTSGLIVVAKNEDMHEKLSELFRERQVFKEYVALCHGEFWEEDRGEIDAPIAREKHNRTKMAVRAHGRNALSLWKVKKRFEKFTLVGVEIKTGRTHQIRVHMAYINHPIVGDETYNAGRDKTVHNLTIRKAIENLGRNFLHAEKLGFKHPVTGEELKFVQPMPAELAEFVEMLEDEV